MEDFGIPSERNLEEIRDCWSVEENVEAEGDVLRGNVIAVEDDDDDVLSDEDDCYSECEPESYDVCVDELEDEDGGCISECEKRNRQKRLINEVYTVIGQEDIEGVMQRFVLDQMVKVAKF